MLYSFVFLSCIDFFSMAHNNFKENFILEFPKNMIKPLPLQKRSYQISPVHLSICLPLHSSVAQFSQDLLLIYIIFCMGIFCHVYQTVANPDFGKLYLLSRWWVKKTNLDQKQKNWHFNEGNITFCALNDASLAT